MDETRFLSIELGTLLVVAFRRETACVLAGHNNINVNHLVLGSWWYARAASTIFTVLRFARSCLASSYRWAPGRDLRYSAAASKIHQGHFSDTVTEQPRIGKVPPRKRRLSRVSTSNTHQSTINHMLAPILGTANKAAQQVIQLKSRENDLSRRHTPISVQAKLHLAVVGLVWRDWFCGWLQSS